MMSIKFVLNPTVKYLKFKGRQLKESKNLLRLQIPHFTYLLLFYRVAMFDRCKQDHLNVIFPQTGGRKKEGNTHDFKLAGSVYFCLYSSVSASPSSCLTLTIPSCPSLPCSAHWAVAATLPEFEPQTGEKIKTWRHIECLHFFFKFT